MGIQRNEYQTDGIIINWMHANYRTAWQASEQEKSYLINIRRQQQLQDDKREAAVVTTKCGGASQSRKAGPGEQLDNDKRKVVVTSRCGECVPMWQGKW